MKPSTWTTNCAIPSPSKNSAAVFWYYAPRLGRAWARVTEDRKKLHPDRKVAVLWVLLLGVFAAFNAAYFPVRNVQAERAPQNFVAYAEKLEKAGHPGYAASQLAAGLGWFHPTDPEPYVRYSALAPAEPNVPITTARGAFYVLLAKGALDSAGVAILPGMLTRSAPGDIGIDLEPVLSLWRTAGFFEPRDLKVSPEQASALVVLAHGMIGREGRIGDAGTTPVPLLAASGERAVLIADGHDFGGSQRGLYVAIISPADGRALQLGSFDLWESWKESRRMAEFLQRAPEGSIGIFAVCKEASVFLDYTYLAPELEYFGIERQAMVNDRLGFYGLNYKFAAIGVKGRTRGLQAWSPGEFAGRKGHPVCVAVSMGSAP